MSRGRKVLRTIAKTTPPTKRIVIKYDNLIAENIELKQRLEIELQTKDIRTILSRKFIHGRGIEIGALHMPLSLPRGARVKYVDYIPLAKLRQQYPELKDLPLVNVDIVDNGEKLSKIKGSSLDFIIANHFFEHCQDPIGTLITFYNKLRDGGIIFMAIPDKRYTFDMNRPITTYAHLLEEHRIYPSKKFYKVHSREIAKLTELLTDSEQIEKRVQKLRSVNYSIHYHVWTQKELVELFHKTAKRFSLGIEIEAMANNIHEVVFVIRKVDKKSEAQKIKDIKKHYFGGINNSGAKKDS